MCFILSKQFQKLFPLTLQWHEWDILTISSLTLELYHHPFGYKRLQIIIYYIYNIIGYQTTCKNLYLFNHLHELLWKYTIHLQCFACARDNASTPLHIGLVVAVILKQLVWYSIYKHRILKCHQVTFLYVRKWLKLLQQTWTSICVLCSSISHGSPVSMTGANRSRLQSIIVAFVFL